MRTKNLRIAAISFGIMALGALSSCTSESGYLNQLPGGSSSTFNLVQTPDVVAYSGDNYFNSSTTASSRSVLTNNSRSSLEWVNGISFDVPAGAEDCTKENYQFDQNAPIYIIPSNIQGEVSNWLNLSNKSLYILGNVTKLNISSADNAKIYVCEGASIKFNPSGNHIVLYNAGDVEITSNGDALQGGKLEYIYNFGNLYIEEKNISNSVNIFSQGGIITLAPNTDFKAKCDIHSTIHVEGNVKIQNDAEKYICGLVVNGNLEVVTNFSTSYIKAKSLFFDGHKITLTPEGHIEVAGTISIINGGSGIFNSPNSIARVDAGTILLQNNTMTSAFGEGVYVYADKVANAVYDRWDQELGNIYKEGSPIDWTNPTDEVGGTPECGEAWGAQPETPPTVDPDPEDPDDPDPDPDPTPGPTPNPPSGVMKYSNNVEVNMEIEDHKDYDAVHTSIHVRHATDIDIQIPFKEIYYCAADDLEIVQSHAPGYFKHDGPESVTYNINGDPVTLNYQFVIEEGASEGYIRIWTEGINEDIINFLSKKFGDGLTFEVWFYTNVTTDPNKAIKKEQLRTEIYEGSTIEFTSIPDIYVNSFNRKYDEKAHKYLDEINYWDCHVDIISTQGGNITKTETGAFLNGSDFNVIFYLK